MTIYLVGITIMLFVIFFVHGTQHVVIDKILALNDARLSRIEVELAKLEQRYKNLRDDTPEYLRARLWLKEGENDPNQNK